MIESSFVQMLRFYGLSILRKGASFTMLNMNSGRNRSDSVKPPRFLFNAIDFRFIMIELIIINRLD